MPRYKPIATNRRARFDYELTDSLIGGLVLSGHEVKSIRAGHVSLKGAFATIMAGELWVNNVHVTPYPPAKLPAGYDPTHARKVLVHAKQLAELIAHKQAGRNIVVQSVGVQGRFIKVELGVGRSKKQYDKRETIKRRQNDREARRAIKNRS